MATEITHAIRIETDLSAATDQESTRYALNNVQILPCPRDPDHVYAIACDSRILAIVQAEGKTDGNPVLMPAKHSKPKRGKAATYTTLNGEWRTSTTKKHNLPKGRDIDSAAVAAMETVAVSAIDTNPGRFPNVAAVIPDDLSGAVVVTLDARLLANLAAALNPTASDIGGKLTLIMRPDAPVVENGPREVTDAVCVTGGAGFGLIMPLAGEKPTTNARGGKDAPIDHANQAVARFAASVAEFRDMTAAK